MADKKPRGAEPLPGRKNDMSTVAEDQNWRSFVDNELKCQDLWNQDWGFLAGGSHGDGGKYFRAETFQARKLRLQRKRRSQRSRNKSKL
jgi:hypothetical protein